MPSNYDVVIIGGGPAGSSVAGFLRKYAPNLRVLVLEREQFPREHVGESLLPIVSRMLHEVGCWEKVEAAGFPVKVGATFRWGTSDDLWDFDFLAGQCYEDAPRPGMFAGQRAATAFQVDRAIFDKILLDHARELGAEARENAKVVKVLTNGDGVDGVVLEDGSTITAKYYIDASGHSGILRRAVGVQIEEPSRLRNVAFWAYWQNAEWAVNIGVSGTRIQVMSLGWGWLWFIPLGPNRTSIGLVTSADYFKNSGKSGEQLYMDSVMAEPDISRLIENAVKEENTYATKDWSFVSSRIAGENWFLAGEAAGFADPILSAGLSITIVGALELAVTIKELEQNRYEKDWLLLEYGRATARRIRSHIHFADYWYSANAHFTELVTNTSKIAEEVGLRMDGKTAWRWLGTGGFVAFGGAGLGGFDLVATDWLVNHLNQDAPNWSIAKYNVFKLNLEGAERVKFAIYNPGEVLQIEGLVRHNRILPAHGVYRFLLGVLAQENRGSELARAIESVWCTRSGAKPSDRAGAYQAWEALVNDGWVSGSLEGNIPTLNLHPLRQCSVFHPNIDQTTTQREP